MTRSLIDVMMNFDDPLVGNVECSPGLLQTFSVGTSRELLSSANFDKLFFFNFGTPNQTLAFANLDATKPSPHNMVFVAPLGGSVPAGRRQLFSANGVPLNLIKMTEVGAGVFIVYWAGQAIVVDALSPTGTRQESQNYATAAMTMKFIPQGKSINPPLDVNLTAKYTIQSTDIMVKPRVQDLGFFSMSKGLTGTVHLMKYLVLTDASGNKTIQTLPSGWTSLPTGVTIVPVSDVIDGDKLCLIVDDGIPFAIDDAVRDLRHGTFNLLSWARSSPASLSEKFLTDRQFHPSKGIVTDVGFFADVHSSSETAFGSVFSMDELQIVFNFLAVMPYKTGHQWSTPDILKAPLTIADGKTMVMDPILPEDFFQTLNTGEKVTLTFDNPVSLTQKHPGIEQLTSSSFSVNADFDTLLVPQVIFASVEESSQKPESIESNPGIIASVVIGCVVGFSVVGLLTFVQLNASRHR